MVRAIHVGYIRWSDPSQAEGDSERRQRESILADTAALGVEIDLWLQDEGLSASTGENLKRGQLGRFLKDVEDGKIPPGSVLYLDEPSRLTRLGPSKAMRILANLEDSGVSLRLSARRQTLHGESLYEILGFIVESAAGHAFTKELGRKLREAWAAKREETRRAPGEKVLTGNTPYGIRATGGSYSIGKGWVGRRYECDPDEVKFATLIFEMARDGYSPRAIARHLNEAGVPSPAASRGRKVRYGTLVWRAEVVRKLLKNRVYLDGSFQPCRMTGKNRKAPDGALVLGCFPVFLPEGLWEAANAEVGKHSRENGASHRSGAANLFTGLLKCTVCGGAVSLRSGGGNGRIAALYCTNARDGACDDNGYIHRWRFEAAALSRLSSLLDPEAILSDLKRAHDVVDRSAVLERLRIEVREKKRAVDILVDRVLSLADSTNADLYEARLTKAREELRELQDLLSRTEEEVGRAEAVVLQRVQAARDMRGLIDMAVYGEPRGEFAGRVDDIAAALKEADRLRKELGSDIEPARIKLKAALRRIIKKVTLKLADETFIMTLETGKEISGKVGEPLRLDGPDDVVVTAYGEV